MECAQRHGRFDECLKHGVRRGRESRILQAALRLARFTLGAVIGFLAVLLLGVAVPLAVSFLPLGPAAEVILLGVRWVLLFAVAVLGLAIVYGLRPIGGQRSGAGLRPVRSSQPRCG